MKKIIFFIMIIYLFIHIFKIEASNKNSLYPKINGIQLFVIDQKYKSNLNKLFQEAKSKGVNTVFFRVFHNQNDRAHFNISLNCNSGVYFKTDALCTVSDILTPVIKAARAEGIKIYAWMATRSLTDLKKAQYISKSFSPEGDIVDGYGSNIFHPEVRQTILNLFNDLAKYDIDGILFQDDFIIKYNEGADIYALNAFYKDTGIQAKPEVFFSGTNISNNKKVYTGYKDAFYNWAYWKNYKLMEFFKEIKLTVKRINPNIMLVANVYYETPIYKKEGLAWYSQNIKALEKSGADYFAVMSYYEQISQEKQLSSKETIKLIGEISQSLKDIKPSSRIAIKLQTRYFKDSKEYLPKTLFKNICNEVNKSKNISIILVPIYSSSDILNDCFAK